MFLKRDQMHDNIIQLHATATLFSRGQGVRKGEAALVGRALPPRFWGLQGATLGTGPSESAATVGLVSPPGGIVLWDEWQVDLEKKAEGKHPARPGAPPAPADKRWSRTAKEVREDRKRK